MVKDDKINIRLTKGTKLIYDMYCKNKNDKVSNLIDVALREYFINHDKVEIYSLISLADKYIYHDKMQMDDVKFELMANDLYEKVMNE